MQGRYGLAMHHGNVLRAAVKNALLTAQLADRRFTTSEEFRQAEERQFRLVLGRILDKLVPFIDTRTSASLRPGRAQPSGWVQWLRIGHLPWPRSVVSHGSAPGFGRTRLSEPSTGEWVSLVVHVVAILVVLAEIYLILGH